MYILNSFSLNMLSSLDTNISIKEISLDEAKTMTENVGIVSAIGHADTAYILSEMLDCDIEFNRMSVKLYKNDVALVCQFFGERLPEGCKKLPEGATIKFALVQIKS